VQLVIVPASQVPLQPVTFLLVAQVAEFATH
jgi:hypothetical protein